ncbi:aspartate/glutamate racemase family protein [Haladaptatus sp. W1]|uniref:aspartate/glutamate racemase family protein n=1 Tax=Haladaptatus sp. W1 TaxID=1897478 RepID=UPI0021135A20|nr:aspartate/glutamate racemase family protein [Haladaptatus sp. W1]
MNTILVLNPNTSEAMTETSQNQQSKQHLPKQKQSSRIQISVRNHSNHITSTISPPSRCSKRLLIIGEKFDGVVIACYGDPGLYPLKEVFDVPVVGVAEASLATATLLGHRFSILVALPRAIPMMENMVHWYGLSNRLASVESTNLSVLELEEDKDETVDALSRAGERAKDAGAEVLILGCSGMAGLQKRVAERTAVPVIDPVENAVKMVGLLAEQGLVQSEAGLYQTPPKKDIRGDMPGDLSR